MRTRMLELAREAQATITGALEALDGTPFREDTWERPGGGGGWSRVLQGGRVFEKAGVNVSAVHGELTDQAAAAMRARKADLPDARHFFATGISLVIHPHNPMAPTAHANYRYFELGDGEACWFGGGADLTPAYLFEDDAVHFHGHLKDACDRTDPGFYPRFKAWCDRYFVLPHRGESRGVGGIFFDDLEPDETHDIEALHGFAADCAAAFVPSYLPIVERRHMLPFGEEQRRWQQLRRGRYVEFNLVWDRGTTFGLRTDARTESVLMSLPLTARWEYDHHPEPGSPEAQMLQVLREPRDWLGA